MGKYSIISVILLGLTSCGKSGKTVNIKVTNPLDISRTETVELDYNRLAQKAGDSILVVTDAAGNEIPSQLTSDSLLIFRVTVPGWSTVTYHVKGGKAATAYDTVSCGRVYPDRLDDLAWENDVVGFRAYGPALQASGERGFGYDLFTKRGTSAPVIQEMYELEHAPGWYAQYQSHLAQGDTVAADELLTRHSYHIDHGYGMDCYAVGPTLGAGVTAIVGEDGIIYPWCYREVEILDNGPLRFRARLTFNPAVIGTDTVTERRDITIDAGENLNRTVITYDGLTSEKQIVSGFSLHDDGPTTISLMDRYISYIDPTLQAVPYRNDDNGEIYLGTLFTAEPDSMAVRTDGDRRHLVGYNTYRPGDSFTYYWGFGWDKGNVESYDAWKKLLRNKTENLKVPLEINY